MRVVWCPHPGLKGEFRGKEEKVLAGRCENENAEDDHEVEAVDEPWSKLRGWPSRYEDGWGQQLDSLEAFPYEKYGIRV